MLSYNEIKEKKYIVYQNEPYEVVSSHVSKKQQRKPVNQTKIRNLSTGKLIEAVFHQSDSVEEAIIEEKPAEYIFEKRSELWFRSPDDPSDRFPIWENIVGEKKQFLKEGTELTVLLWENPKTEEFDIIGIRLPIKMDLEVIDAPPAIKGNTVSGGTKQVTLETGTIVNVPMFIENGNKVRINTETGEYVERA